MDQTTTPDFDDNNFLQDWLEKRYGCGFAQRVLDDIAEKPSQAEIKTATYILPIDMIANDNAHPQDDRKIS
jgi:hypothetical protein